jgi:hypothetical protein
MPEKADTNGFVDGRRRRLRAVRWADVATVTRERMGNRTRVLPRCPLSPAERIP